MLFDPYFIKEYSHGNILITLRIWIKSPEQFHFLKLAFYELAEHMGRM